MKLQCKGKQKEADKIAAFLMNASDRLLFHIPLYEIGKAFGISREDILDIFTYFGDILQFKHRIKYSKALMNGKTRFYISVERIIKGFIANRTKILR